MGPDDLPASRNVVVLAEVDEDNDLTHGALQLMGLGKELASCCKGRLYAVILGKDLTSACIELSRCGPDEVFCADDGRLSEYNPDAYVPILTGLCEVVRPGLLISGHTSVGQDLLPRLAFALDAGLVTDCLDIRVKEGALFFVRPVYGGNALATQRARTGMALATVRAGAGKPPYPSTNAGRITPLGLASLPDTRMRIIGRTCADTEECPLEDARVVVSGGRGMGGEEGFQTLRELARLLGGAMGATRQPCDLGWAPSSCQIGITGRIVAPDLYIAVGISGSTQHLSGMGDSRKIVAINRDPEANIFNVADYGVVGDWRQVLPPFAAAVKRLLGSR